MTLHLHRDYRDFSRRAPNQLLDDANIKSGHPANGAAWIWGKDGLAVTRYLRFELDFDWEEPQTSLDLYISADHRYQMSLDDRPISFGPDRSDPRHWKVTPLQLPLTSGRHRLVVLAWYIEEPAGGSRLDPVLAGGDETLAHPPMAQMTYRPGFILATMEPRLGSRFNTGFAPWRVFDLTASVRHHKKAALGYHDIGPSHRVELESWHKGADVPLVVVRPPFLGNIYGVVIPGWVLESTELPEQKREFFKGGIIRAVRQESDEGLWWESPLDDSQRRSWQDLVERVATVEVTPHSRIEVLWDFDSYQCGYPSLTWSGGLGSSIEVEWAESLFLPCSSMDSRPSGSKGRRDEIGGKIWLGFGDTFLASGLRETSPTLWWRSGRYLRLRLRVGAQALLLERMQLLTTGYPMVPCYSWASSDKSWDSTLPLLARGLEVGAHETWVDCPYYEQLSYVGDTRLHALSNMLLYSDDRLSQNALVQFAQSRSGHGLVAERYPSHWRQESGTYALLYPCMVEEAWLWRGRRDQVLQLLPEVRGSMERCLEWLGSDGAVNAVAGWPCVDWVRGHEWRECSGPGMREGDSSIVNFHFILAALALARLEEAMGDLLLAQRWKGIARICMQATIDRYWNPNLNCFNDTRLVEGISEHAQVLALLTGLLEQQQQSHCAKALLKGQNLAQCTLYFSHYLFEVYRLLGAEEALHERLQYWKSLRNQGFCTLPESPEPARSDAHGWGAHPLFHTFATIAGLRPLKPGLQEVEMAPLPGPLTNFQGHCFHPLGEIRFSFKKSTSRIRFQLELPLEISGQIRWKGMVYALPKGGGVCEVPHEAILEPPLVLKHANGHLNGIL